MHVTVHFNHCRIVKLFTLLALMTVLVACTPYIVAPDSDSDYPVDDPEATTGALPVVAMLTIVEHPAIDEEWQGVINSMAAAGYVDDKSIKLITENADGDINELRAIAKRYVDDGVDLIIATGTPALGAAYEATKESCGPPVVFHAVGNPLAIGFIESLKTHPEWIIGTQILTPVEEALSLIAQIVPNVRSVGYVYNPSEALSASNTEIAVRVAEERGLELIIETVFKSDEVSKTVQSLAGRGVDALFVGTDYTVLSALDAIVDVAAENDVPLFANDLYSVRRGAVAGVNADYYADGRHAGELAAGILTRGISVPNSSIVQQAGSTIAVNLGVAESHGLVIPQDLRDMADIIIE